MKVSCPACEAKYTIADDKVSGRKVKVRCKSCGGQIVVDGTELGRAAPASDDDDDDATRVFSSKERDALLAEAIGGAMWAVNVSDNDERSMSTAELVDAFMTGSLGEEPFVWRDGMSDWALVPDVPELAAAIALKKAAQPALISLRPEVSGKSEPAPKPTAASHKTTAAGVAPPANAVAGSAGGKLALGEGPRTTAQQKTTVAQGKAARTEATKKPTTGTFSAVGGSVTAGGARAALGLGSSSGAKATASSTASGTSGSSPKASATPAQPAVTQKATGPRPVAETAARAGAASGPDRKATGSHPTATASPQAHEPRGTADAHKATGPRPAAAGSKPSATATPLPHAAPGATQKPEGSEADKKAAFKTTQLGLGQQGQAAVQAAIKAAEKTTSKAQTASQTAERKPATQDLFAGVRSAGSEAEAISGSEPEDAKMTGARNENSVLFSLDALKAGMTGTVPAAAASGKPSPAGPAPKRKGVPTAPQKRLEDLLETAEPLMPAAGMNPLIMTGNQALLTAPAPPPPPPTPPPPPPTPDPTTVVAAPKPTSAATDIDVDWHPARGRSKKKLMIMVGLGALLLGAGLVVALSSGGDEKADLTLPSASAEIPKVAALPTSPPTSTPEPSASTQPSSTVAAASATASASPVAMGAGGSRPVTPVAGVGTKPPDSGSAGTKPTAAATPPPPSNLGDFNVDAARSALQVAASAAQSCKRPEGPWGTGKVQVTFAPSGRATQAVITGGSFGGTAVGSCVSNVFRRAQVPAFSGRAKTVAKSFTISH